MEFIRMNVGFASTFLLPYLISAAHSDVVFEREGCTRKTQQTESFKLLWIVLMDNLTGHSKEGYPFTSNLKVALRPPTCSLTASFTASCLGSQVTPYINYFSLSFYGHCHPSLFAYCSVRFSDYPYLKCQLRGNMGNCGILLRSNLTKHSWWK